MKAIAILLKITAACTLTVCFIFLIIPNSDISKYLKAAIPVVGIMFPSKEDRINFSDYSWKVKSSVEPAGPGPNYFSPKAKNVWVDSKGFLHLKLRYSEGKWLCSEVICTKALGYGKYIFEMEAPLDKLDPNVVLGLFTYEDNPAEDNPNTNNREIDIEFSKWGNPADANSQYAVQPYETPGNLVRFDTKLNGSYTTHIIDWQRDSIEFKSLHGFISSSPDSEYIINSHKYTGKDIPTPGNENTRINLYLVKGQPPTDGKVVEVVIHSFKFIPSN